MVKVRCKAVAKIMTRAGWIPVDNGIKLTQVRLIDGKQIHVFSGFVCTSEKELIVGRIEEIGAIKAK